MNFANIDIKMEASKRGVKLYEIPSALSTSNSTFYRMMRTELNEANRAKVLEAIRKVAASKYSE